MPSEIVSQLRVEGGGQYVALLHSHYHIEAVLLLRSASPELQAGLLTAGGCDVTLLRAVQSVKKLHHFLDC